jgi:hypothetical protein
MCIRYVYSKPGDARLSAVDVKADIFLAWVEMALTVPPFFFQLGQVDIKRDPKREPNCQITALQVPAKQRLPATRAAFETAGLRIAELATWYALCRLRIDYSHGHRPDHFESSRRRH